MDSSSRPSFFVSLAYHTHTHIHKILVFFYCLGMCCCQNVRICAVATYMLRSGQLSVQPLSMSAHALRHGPTNLAQISFDKCGSHFLYPCPPSGLPLPLFLPIPRSLTAVFIFIFCFNSFFYLICTMYTVTKQLHMRI